MWSNSIVILCSSYSKCQLVILLWAVQIAFWPSWSFLRVTQMRLKVHVSLCLTHTHAHTSLPLPWRCKPFSKSAASHSLFPPVFFLFTGNANPLSSPLCSSLLSSPLLVTTQSSLTKSTFNASLGPLVLPERGGWILAAMCDPTLINRVGEGKGAMHTPIHYFIRMAHSERWSPSLYLNEGDWTRHSVSHPVRLLLSANAQNQPPVFLLCSA